MNRWILVLALAVACTIIAPAPAAVISRDWKTPGDGLLTYDDVNQREWLDLTETRLAMFPGATVVERYQSFLGELGPGRPFEGFTVAKADDLVAFATSAGIDASTNDFATNHGSVETLIGLVGISYGPSGLGTRASFGLVDAGTPPNAIRFGRLMSAPESGDFGFAQLYVGPGFDDLATVENTGVWILRNVPEPSSLVTAMMTILSLGMRKRVSRRRARPTRKKKRLAFEAEKVPGTFSLRLPLAAARGVASPRSHSLLYSGGLDIMYRGILLLTIGSACAFASSTQAAVISRDWKAPGDGLLTYDDVNQREWLDLTESRLSMFPGANFEQRYQNALPEFDLGGRYFGFQPAKTPDLSALGASAGLVPGGDFDTNANAARLLLELVGPSATSSDPDDGAAYGLLDEIERPGRRLYGELIHFKPRPATQGTATLRFLGNLELSDLATAANSGIWMYRAVPEPSSFLWSTLGFLAMGVSRRRQRRTGKKKRKKLHRGLSPNRAGFEVLEDRRLLASADIVFVVDESESNLNDPTHVWLRNLVARLEDTDPAFHNELSEKSITDVRYGLIGFGGKNPSVAGQQATDHAYSFVVDSSASSATGKLIGTNAQLLAKLDQAPPVLGRTGIIEDGWDAIEHAIAEFPFRENAVPVIVLVQNEQGRSYLDPFVGEMVNATLTREGVLAALQSKNVLVNSLVVGARRAPELPGENSWAARDLFDLAQYGVHPDIRILGVEADVFSGDTVPDGQHTYHWFDTNTLNGTADSPVATTSQALQVSFNGSNTGATGLVGSHKSILFSKTATSGIGPSVGGYRATAQPFSSVNMSGASVIGADSATSLGFNFSFYGTSFSQVWVGDNGTIRFGNSSVDPGVVSPNNADLSRPPLDPELDPARPGNIPLIAALWDDLNPASTGSALGEIRRKSFDLDNNGQADMLAIEWTNYVYNLDYSVVPDTISFQVALHADGRIVVNYLDLESSTAPIISLEQGPPASGGVNATVGLWRGTTDNVTLPVGKYVPGPHSFFGSRQSRSPDPSETNDNYVRLAWDTGGAAWDLGVVVETSATSAIANRLRDDFVDSLGDQIAQKAALGKLRGSDQVLLALNLGGSQVDLGAAGVFRADNGAFAATGGDSYAVTGSPTIELKSNAIPSTAAGMQTVFRSGRGERSADASPSNDHEAENVAVIITHLDPNPFTPSSMASTPMPNGRYIVELFFADTFVPEDPGRPETATRRFDVVIEGVTYLTNYSPQDDFAEISTGTTEFPTSKVEMFSGVVKRFEVDVSASSGDADLQINLIRRSGSTADPILSAVRLLRADAPRVKDVVVKGTNWAPGVEYSFATLVGLGQQLRPVATLDPDTIEVYFDGPVSIGAEALKLAKTVRNYADINGAPTNSIIAGDDGDVDFEYDPVNYIARWVFPAAGAKSLESGKYAVFLLTDEVTGGGQHLDGEWENDFGRDAFGQPTADYRFDDAARVFLSGKGVAGAMSGYFRLNFALLVGDYAGNGYVDGSDLMLYQTLIGDGWSPADGNGDGATNGSDQAIWSTHSGNFLALYALHGADLYDDDVVNGADLAVWRAHYLATGQGDIDGDGNTDGNDLLLWQGLVESYSAWWAELPITTASAVVVGDFAPRVLNVIVRGSLTTHAPFSFDTVDGSGAQLATVPVGGADTVSIVFSEAVNVSANSLGVVGLRTANLPQLAEFSYNASTYTATWRFEGWALADQYLLALSDRITDVDGNWLDGEWTNPATLATTNSAVSEFPSGDGEPGGWFTFVMTLMPGDATRDNIVDYYDHYGVWIFNQDQFWGDATWIDGDFNGDGYVDGADMPQAMGTFLSNFQNLWLLADLDGDFDVDAADLLTIANNAGMTGATWEDGDLNGDGEVTENDLDIALAHWGLMGKGLFLNVVA